MSAHERASVVDLADVAEHARRLLASVERGELVADDPIGRRMVEIWRHLATAAEPPTSTRADIGTSNQ